MLIQSGFKINLEDTYDHFGELEFGDVEVESILKLLSTDDVTVLRKLNPI
jgi:hypothetical protein